MAADEGSIARQVHALRNSMAGAVANVGYARDLLQDEIAETAGDGGPGVERRRELSKALEFATQSLAMMATQLDDLCATMISGSRAGPSGRGA